MDSTIKAYTSSKIFTGENWVSNQAIVVENGIIKEIVPVQSLPSSVAIEHFDECILAPAFIDLQIYGAYGKLFSVYPETESLLKLHEYCEKSGTAFCLPTVATNKEEIFFQCIDAVREYWNTNGKGILGLHIEGPWINPAKRGAHIESLIHTPTFSEVDNLLKYGKGVIRMITLAPECCSREIIERILEDDIVISAGHSNASYNQAKNSFTNGITTVTHLYNAMSSFHHRQPGLVGAVMDDDKVMASIIPDGYHVDYAAIRIAKKTMKERLFVITDAVTETTKGQYQHQLAGDKYEAANILSGSALTMIKALQNLVNHAEVNIAEAMRMCSWYPAQVIKADHYLGKLLPGYNAEMIILDKELNCAGLIRN